MCFLMQQHKLKELFKYNFISLPEFNKLCLLITVYRTACHYTENVIFNSHCNIIYFNFLGDYFIGEIFSTTFHKAWKSRNNKSEERVVI